MILLVPYTIRISASVLISKWFEPNAQKTTESRYKGIKALCESTSGYCNHFQIYTGAPPYGAEHGFLQRVVFDLMTKYLDKGYGVYMSIYNFYTSIQHLKSSKERNTFACGTVHVNSGEFPNDFKVGMLHLESQHLFGLEILLMSIGREREMFL